MKRFLISIAIMTSLLVTAVIIQATNFPLAKSGDTYSTTLIGPTTSNKTSATVFIEGFSMHTFQVVTVCTNAVSNIFYVSLNGTNWIPFATNSVSATATNGITLSQRWSYLQATFTQTTANGSTNTVLYLGGRQ